MCDKIPQYTTKHSIPKLPNMLRSVINFFYLSPSQHTLWLINLIMTQYHSYTGLINYLVFQGYHLLLEEKKSFLLQQIPLEGMKHLVISILEEEWWAGVMTTDSTDPCSSRYQAPSLACGSPLKVSDCWPASNEYLVLSPVLLPCFWYMCYKTEDSFSVFRKMGWSWTPVRTASSNNFS